MLCRGNKQLHTSINLTKQIPFPLKLHAHHGLAEGLCLAWPPRDPGGEGPTITKLHHLE